MRSRDLFVFAASQVKFTPCVLAAIISVLCVPNAKASTITYTESATVSGSLNGVSFASKLLTLTGTGDTANITNGVPIAIHLTATFGVAGVGSGTFTDTFEVFDNQGAAVAGFEDIAQPANLLDTANNAFATYNLSTSIGPLTGSSLINPGFSFPTTAGALILNSAGDATFTAVVTPVVPLPAALPLFASGLAGLVLLGWRRKRKAQAV